ncbi:ABC transporter ATP-binding protein [Pseudactinotalea terrae]|uniref:ABC transporter ATP-binding protein n=1 Tax=Pseudactinotalea terrae TaxID=1743262 RepID=UPI0012E21C12|nr:ABC transporter ATP-binding protein [Pseudactinotalea terrae]
MKLPIADGAVLRARVGDLLRMHRGSLAKVVGLHTGAAVAGLAGPWLLGRIIDDVSTGTTASALNTMAAALAVAVLLQTVLVRQAQRSSIVLGEQVFAQMREDLIEVVTSLPLSTVERAGTGDLIARTTNDVDRINFTVRFGVPRVLVATASILLTVLAAVLTNWLVALGMFVGLPILLVACRWYLKRAAAGYLRESAAYATINGSLTESVEGARTVDALGLGKRRRDRTDADVREAFEAEKYTLWLRTWLFPGLDAAFILPIIAILAWGAYLASTGQATVGAVTTVLLYAVQVIGPVDELIFWLDEIQVGTARLARIFGVGLVQQDRVATGLKPSAQDIHTRDLEYAYREGQNVLHGIDLDLQPGERLAIVGPSGAGKSTLGRMLAGIHPPSGGKVTVGDVPLVELELEDLRGQVALVTQEHHVFVGTLAQNLRLAKQDATDDELADALRAVDAWGWVVALENGLATEVGSGGVTLSPAQAQQIALARLVLLDPHTLVLDEATSLLDPRAARHLERSLSAVLHGRTVVAIAHRLHTAHDADRVAVVADGRIDEIGPHDDLVAAEGSYAALWHSWQRE